MSKSNPTKPSRPTKPAPRSKSSEASPGSAPNPVVMADGRWKFSVTKDGESHDCELDILETQLEIEKLQREHGIAPIDGQLRPTPEFMQAFVAILERLGVPATPAIAFQVLAHIGRKFDALMREIHA